MAKDEARRVFRLADPDWTHGQIKSGLSTGEGLIYAIRDEVFAEKPTKDGEFSTVKVDNGVEDKRLLALQGEFAGILKVAAREGNTLSEVVRDAWDSLEVLRVMSKTSPNLATGPHVSIIGHSTPDDIQKYLSDTEVGNGFANRFLWVCSQGSKSLPHGGNLADADLAPLARRLERAKAAARRLGRITRDEKADELWEKVYPYLGRKREGLYGAITGRAQAQTLRLSLVYALLDAGAGTRSAIAKQHLTAALALWDYCDQSVRYIFGDAIGDRTADKILSSVRQRRGGMTRTEVNDLFGGRLKAEELDRAISLLERLGRITSRIVATTGRSETRYFAL